MSWTQAITSNDAINVFGLRTKADPVSYSDSSKQKMAMEVHSANFEKRWADPTTEQCWVYDDGTIQMTFDIQKVGQIGRITNAVIIGDCEAGFPMLRDKLKEIMSVMGITRAHAESPRTEMGESMAFYCQLTMSESIVVLSDDKTYWQIDINLNQQFDLEGNSVSG